MRDGRGTKVSFPSVTFGNNLGGVAELIQAAGELWDGDRRDSFRMLQLAQMLTLCA